MHTFYVVAATVGVQPVVMPILEDDRLSRNADSFGGPNLTVESFRHLAHYSVGKKIVLIFRIRDRVNGLQPKRNLLRGKMRHRVKFYGLRLRIIA